MAPPGSSASVTNNSRPGTVFISYKREEASVAEVLYAALKDAGFNVWWDEDVQCGQAWAEKLDEAVRDAACVVVLWSEQSIASEWVRHEASQAIASGVYAPCRIELVKLDPPYDRIQATDLIDWDGDTTHAGFRDLLQRVDTLVPAPVSLSRRIGRRLTRNAFALGASFIAILAIWLLGTIYLAQQADRREKLYDCSASTALRTQLAYERYANQESLQYACLSRCEFRQADFREAAFPKADLSRAHFGGANLSGAVFFETDLSGAILARADLSRAYLVGANLSGAQLSNANLSDAVLGETDLSEAALPGANLKRANLDQTDFRKASLRGADLRQARFDDTDLTGADLAYANLTDAILLAVEFSEANLRKATLGNVALGGVDLSKAQLEGADMDGATYSRDTKWPPNFDPEAAGAVLVKNELGPSRSAPKTK